jgi:hypothetical protein
MAHIVKVIRMLNKGHYGLAEVELDDGGRAVVYVGGEVRVILHNQVIKAYVVPPWTRPKQSRQEP